MEIVTLDLGRLQKLMDVEFILGKMEINMRGNGKIVSNMDREQINLQMVTAILGTTSLESQMGEASISG